MLQLFNLCRIKAVQTLTLSILVYISHSLAIAQSITSINPIVGNIGSTITITGSGFNSSANNNIVFFGPTRASVNSASSNSLSVTVPIGATFGPISILNISTGLIAQSVQFFNPTFSPNKGTISSSDILSKVDFSTGSSPRSVAIGDLDGDGKVDLVTANSLNGPNISVLRNTSTIGNISFSAKIDITTSAQPNKVEIADIDGDGKLDVIIANQLSTTISILRNTSTVGTISFGSILDFSIASAYSNAEPELAIADINGDSKLDIIAINTSGSSTFSILRNTSSSSLISFATSIDFNTGAGPSSLSISDFDGDGKVDVAVTNSGSGNISILRNTSTINTISLAS